MEQVDSITDENYSNFVMIHSNWKGNICKAVDGHNNKVILKSFVKSMAAFSFIKDPETEKLIPKELFYLRQLTGNRYVPKLLDYHDGRLWSTIVIEFLDNDWMDVFDYTDVYHNEDCIKAIVKSVIDIMYDMSINGFYHRDIKPENIMVNKSTLEVKLIDFEDILYSREKDPMSLATCGTTGYKSPESFSDSPCEIKPCIVFSIGCTVYSCLELKTPFETELETRKCKIPSMNYCSELAASFISKCLKRNPDERIDFHSLINDEWFA